MTEEELRDKIQIAISKPEAKYKSPYARTSDSKELLHIYMVDTKKASEEVIKLLKEINLIP